MIPSFCNQSITRIRPSTKNVRGTTIHDWANATKLVISPVSVQPSASSIDINGRVLGVTDSYIVYCNADADVKVGDRILFESNTYTVDEDIRTWHSPTGAITHSQFTMIRYEG